MPSEKYFASQSTGDGFKSYYGDIYGKMKRVYVIKGGAGTGKSTLMEKIAAEGEKRGYHIERFYCSSDPASLDGVVIKENSFAVVDGTAPHVYEPRYAGARDVIVDLGANWDTGALREKYGEIRELTDKKSALFGNLYSCLSGMSKLDREMREISSEALDKDKTNAFLSRVFKTKKKGGGAAVLPVEAYTSKGLVRFASYEDQAGVNYIVSDRFGAAYAFLTLALSFAAECGEKAVYSPFWLDPSCVSSFLIPDRGVSFSAEAGGDGKNVNIDRFLSKEKIRKRAKYLRFLRKCTETLKTEADAIYSEIAELHGRIESIYIPAMDYSKNDETASVLLSEIFSF